MIKIIRRPAISILLVTDLQVARADFSSGRRSVPLGQWTQLQIPGGSLATSVEFAASLGPKLAKRVVVLTTQAWTQTVSLPMHAASLADDELQQTLKFEIESFSGIEAMHSQIGFIELGRDPARNENERRFRVTQLQNSDVTEVADILGRRGGKLVGIASPIGVPKKLNNHQRDNHNASAERWSRLEFWKETVCLVGFDTGLQTDISDSPPQSDRWLSLLSPMGMTVQPTESLVQTGVSVPFQHLTEPTLRLDDETSLNTWFTAWAEQFPRANVSANVPLIRPAAKRASEQTRMTRALTAAAVLLAICVGHYIYVRGNIKRLDAEAAEIEEIKTAKQGSDKQLEALNKEIGTVSKELAEITAERQQIHGLTSRRDRLAVMLRSLAANKTTELVVSMLEPSEHGLILTGESLSPTAASEFARMLRGDLRFLGWEVQAPTQTGRNTMTNGGPWDFSIDLHDVTAAPREEESKPRQAKSESNPERGESTQKASLQQTTYVSGGPR